MTNLVSGAITRIGTPLPFSPDWTWNGGGENVWSLNSPYDLYLNGNFAGTGEMNNALSEASVQIGDFWLFGAGLGVRGDNWSVDLLISSLTDEAEPAAINKFSPLFTAANGVVPLSEFTFNEQFMLSPRTYRLMLRCRF